MWRDQDPRSHDTESLARRGVRARRSEPREPRRLGPSRGPAARPARCLYTRARPASRQPQTARHRCASARTSSPGSDVRLLATVGAFRAVPQRDLEPTDARTRGGRDRQIEHLRSSGLIETRPFGAGRSRTTLVTLTERGRDLLDAAQDRSLDDRQRFYAGFARRPEITHDAHFHRAYERAARGDQRTRWPCPARGPRLRAEARLSALPPRAQSPEAGQRRQARSHGRRGSGVGAWRTGCRTRTSTSSFPMSASSTRTGMVAGRSKTSRSSRLTTAAPMPPPRGVRASSNTALAALGSVAAAGADAAGRSIRAWQRTSCRD